MPDPPVTAAQMDQQRAWEVVEALYDYHPLLTVAMSNVSCRPFTEKAIASALAAVRAEQAATDTARRDCDNPDLCADHVLELTTKIETLEQARDALRQALEWYQERAESLERYFNTRPPKPEAAVAVTTELALDAGRRARKALEADHG